MAELGWEKTATAAPQRRTLAQQLSRWKFLLIGIGILAVAAYLLVSQTGAGARYYVTVDELVTDSDMYGKQVRVAGAVVGDPMFDPQTHELTFIVANIPNSNDEIEAQGGLPAVLHNAVEDPNSTRMTVIYNQSEIPDLLQNEAQAIMTGRLVEENGGYVFHATEVTLKCPTRYEDDVPEQVVE
jgi:cytochrome c-type biogenesis protein CcmE